MIIEGAGRANQDVPGGATASRPPRAERLSAQEAWCHATRWVGTARTGAVFACGYVRSMIFGWVAG